MSTSPDLNAMRRCHRGWAALLIGMLCASLTPAAEPTPEAVRQSIDRGVRFLKQQQNGRDGSWTEHPGQKGGATALCTLALINSGVPIEDPHVQMALNYLRDIGNPESTYATSLQTMVFCEADPARDRFLIRRNVDWLEQAQVGSGPGKGGWSYKLTGSPDNSNSQFALLALHEAQAQGVPVGLETWQQAAAYWSKRQLPDGAWGYRTSAGTGSMTCAGTASMIIATRNLRRGDAYVAQNKIICCGNQEKQADVERGLQWLGRNFSVTRNPSSNAAQSQAWLFYYMYGLERVGRMSGRRFIGDHDWFREGVEMFLSRQDVLTGGWEGGTLRRADVATAMALLFLSKGRRPVLISKLKHSPKDDWNRHRQDLKHLTGRMENLWDQKMTWQVIDAQKATTQDLLQTPVLFISGKDGLKLNKREKEALKEYVTQGGFIFAEAACGSERFDRDFRALMKELFPDSPLRLLPPDHPVWYAEQRVDPDRMRPLYGLETCCRTSVIYSPDNLGCYWELAHSETVKLPPEPQREMEAVLAMGANVLAYATGRELRDKLEVPLVAAEQGADDPTWRGALAIAKLEHGGGSDDAPAALTNLLRVAEQQLGVDVVAEKRLLTLPQPSSIDYPILFFQGRRNFEFTPEQREAIAEFVRNGGFLFGDAICASEPFAKSMRRELALIFPDHPLQRIPPNHPVFTSAYRGFDLPHVSLRRPQARDADEGLGTRVEQVAPELEGIAFDGRYGVIFSPYDLSCALENHVSMECTGYTQEDAAKLGINVILYAMQE